MNTQKKLIIGLSGASGAIYGVRLLEILQSINLDTHLIVSKTAKITLALETKYKIKDLENMVNHYYRHDDLTAAPASGSFLHHGMIIAPCSVRLMCSIAYGIGESLLSRAADVTLKERRKLILVLRETPLTLTHINAMKLITEMGGIIAPPVPAFYNHPQTVQDIVNHSVGRVLDLLEIENNVVKRWQEITSNE